MTPRRSLVLLLGSMALALLAYPVESSDHPPSEPLTMEVRSVGCTEPVSADVRVRFRNLTRSRIVVHRPVDKSCGWWCRSSVPDFVFAISRNDQLSIGMYGVFANTSHNRATLDQHWHLVLPPRGWRDVDVTPFYPIDKFNPSTVQCMYIRTRPESGRPGPYIEIDGTFVGRVISEPLPVRK